MALNDEIAALVRTGIPLDSGLKRLSHDLSGRLKPIAEQLGQELDRGTLLPEALESSGVTFPPIYRAVVEAGIRAGRLPAALETVAQTTRRLAEARRTVAASFVYPIFIFLIAWQLVMFFFWKIWPAMLFFSEDSSSIAVRILEGMAGLGKYAHIWSPAIQLAVVVPVLIWAYRSSRASLLQPAWSSSLFGWLPWIGPMVCSYRQAAFAEVLQLLIQHDVPLPEAIRLTAKATGTRRTQDGAEEIAAAIERGEKLGRTVNRGPRVHTSSRVAAAQWPRSGVCSRTLYAMLPMSTNDALSGSRPSAQLYMAPPHDLGNRRFRNRSLRPSHLRHVARTTQFHGKLVSDQFHADAMHALATVRLHDLPNNATTTTPPSMADFQYNANRSTRPPDNRTYRSRAIAKRQLPS